MNTPERAIRDFLLSHKDIHDLIGKQVYISRIPKDAQKTVLVLSRTTTIRDYSINEGEEDSAQALIGIDVYSRNLAAISICYALTEKIRELMSGFIGEMGGICFYALTIDSEDYLSTPNQDGSDDWIHSYTAEYRGMYSQPKTKIAYYGS